MVSAPFPIDVATISDQVSCISIVVGVCSVHFRFEMKELTTQEESQAKSCRRRLPMRNRRGGCPSQGSQKKFVVRPSPIPYFSRFSARGQTRSIPLQTQEAHCGGHVHQIELPLRYLIQTHFTHRESRSVTTSQSNQMILARLQSQALLMPSPPSSLGLQTSFQDMKTLRR